MKVRFVLFLTIFLFASRICSAVSNRVIGDVSELKKLGFEVTVEDGNAGDVISLGVIAPNKFDLGIDDGGIKPFSGIAFIKTLRRIADGPRMIGAQSTHFPLETKLLDDGRYKSTINIQRGDLANSYFMVKFTHERRGDWPMLIHIPISRIIEAPATSHPMNERIPCFEAQRLVEFYETDMAGIVHFSNFFRYMESAEHAFLRSLGYDPHSRIDGLETGWPRVNATCDYRRPVRFGDTLTIQIFIDEVRKRSVRYAFELHHDGETVATGTIAAAYVSITSDGIQAVPIPEALREKLLTFTTAR